jgi:hypothetical protein
MRDWKIECGRRPIKAHCMTVLIWAPLNLKLDYCHLGEIIIPHLPPTQKKNRFVDFIKILQVINFPHSLFTTSFVTVKLVSFSPERQSFYSGWERKNFPLCLKKIFFLCLMWYEKRDFQPFSFGFLRKFIFYVLPTT